MFELEETPPYVHAVPVFSFIQLTVWNFKDALNMLPKSKICTYVIVMHITIA